VALVFGPFVGNGAFGDAGVEFHGITRPNGSSRSQRESGQTPRG
jgi:hypothetical protein